jgi:hypothetical protein
MCSPSRRVFNGLPALRTQVHQGRGGPRNVQPLVAVFTMLAALCPLPARGLDVGMLRTLTGLASVLDRESNVMHTLSATLRLELAHAGAEQQQQAPFTGGGVESVSSHAVDQVTLEAARSAADALSRLQAPVSTVAAMARPAPTQLRGTSLPSGASGEAVQAAPVATGGGAGGEMSGTQVLPGASPLSYSQAMPVDQATLEAARSAADELSRLQAAAATVAGMARPQLRGTSFSSGSGDAVQAAPFATGAGASGEILGMPVLFSPLTYSQAMPVSLPIVNGVADVRTPLQTTSSVNGVGLSLGR